MANGCPNAGYRKSAQRPAPKMANGPRTRNQRPNSPATTVSAGPNPNSDGSPFRRGAPAPLQPKQSA
eukprot:7514464-Lingulodinium_polyedra.AAC.1